MLCWSYCHYEKISVSLDVRLHFFSEMKSNVCEKQLSFAWVYVRWLLDIFIRKNGWKYFLLHLPWRSCYIAYRAHHKLSPQVLWWVFFSKWIDRNGDELWFSNWVITNVLDFVSEMRMWSPICWLDWLLFFDWLQVRSE